MKIRNRKYEVNFKDKENHPGDPTYVHKMCKKDVVGIQKRGQGRKREKQERGRKERI